MNESWDFYNINLSDGTQNQEIRFYYGLPHQHQEWQDPYHGSIEVDEVCINGLKQSFRELPIDMQIQVRRHCWNYLEHHRLFLVTNVILLSLFLGFHTNKMDVSRADS